MKWEEYKLYQKLNILDEFGQATDEWEFIQDIKVVTSSKLYFTVGTNVVYRAFKPTAITTFKAFENDGCYKIENLSNVYKVESFNARGRYTQLLLKEVV